LCVSTVGEMWYHFGMNYLIAFLNSFSQVLLIENKFFGLLIFVSLFLVKPRVGIFSTIATILSLIFSSLVGVEKSLINAGIMGFNSVLIGIVCALFISKNELAILITIIAVIVAILLQLLFLKYNISIFTLPFALIAIILFLLKNKF
jgi:urea transporter